jgi:hypothetical protein
MPMIVDMGSTLFRGARVVVPLSLLAAILAIAPAAMALDVSQTTGAVAQTASALTQTASTLTDPVQQAVQQAQGTVDQVQSSLGPAQQPTQGAVDNVQSAVGTAVPGSGGGSSSSPRPAGTAPSPSSGSRGSSTRRAPRGSGGSATSRSGGSRVSTGSARTSGGGSALSAAAARRALAGVPASIASAKPSRNARAQTKTGGRSGDPVTRTFTKLVRVVPLPIKLIIGLLAALAIVLGVRSWLQGRHARRLERQREELLDDVGLLQRALLPEVPERIGALATSVAYRPADGPAAGGDFYDVFSLPDGKVAVIVGDVCGHGRQALAQTALIRYTLRAYIDAGLGPRGALQVAGRALANDLAGELTTVVVAVYDPEQATLTYACAGHEPPILLGPAEHEPVVAASAPPVGAGIETGMRETRVSLPRGSSACFFTDGLVEARVDGGLLGRRRLSEMLAELRDDEGAKALLVQLAQTAQRAPDDMAACIVRATAGAPTGTERLERLEVRAGDDWSRAELFLAACGVDESRVAELIRSARLRASEFGAAVLSVTLNGGQATVDVEQPDLRGMTILPPLQPGDASLAL